MEAPKPLPKPERPFALTLLCLFAGVYFFILAALFVAGFFYSGWVTQAINIYSPVIKNSQVSVSLALALLSLLFILGVAGIFLMFRMRRTGYYIFGISSFLLAAIQLFKPVLSFSGPIIFILFLILFGLYFRRFR
jgi:hypothetical protein